MEEENVKQNRDDSQQSGLVGMTVTEDNPIIFRSMVNGSEVAPFVEENHDKTAEVSQFQDALMPANQSGTSQQISSPSRRGQGSTSLTPVKISGGDFDAADNSQQSGFVDMTVTERNPIIFRSMVNSSDVVPFVEENHDITAVMPQFQDALMLANQSSTNQQISLPSRGGQGSSVTPVEITGGDFDAAHIGDKTFNATKNIGVAGGDFKGAHIGQKNYFYINSGQLNHGRPSKEDVTNTRNCDLQAGEKRGDNHGGCLQEVRNMSTADSTSDEITLLNDVWMSFEDASIVSLFCKNDSSLSQGHDYLEPNYKRVILLPGEVFASMGNTVQVDCLCTVPPDIMKLTPDIKQLKITKTMIRKRWHQICLKPSPNPNLLERTEPYEMVYVAKLFNCDGKPTQGGFSAGFNFRWPFHSLKKGSTEVPCHACVSCTQKSHSKRDARKRCQKDRVEVNTRQRAAHTELVPDHDAHYASFIENELEQSCEKKAQKEVVMTSEGNSVKHEGGEIHFQRGAVNKNAKITVTVDNDPDRFPGMATTISSSIECKAPELSEPMRVELTSWLAPKPGEELKVQIISTTRGGEKKKIREIILTEERDLIVYETSHFCWHVAVVSPDDAKSALCHLFNDVWMDVKFGRILSVFYRDEKALRDGTRALEKHHKRIIPMPGEIIASTTSKIMIEFQCNSPTGTRIVSLNRENAQVEISEELFKKRFSFVTFRCLTHPDNILSNEPYDIFYQAKIVSESHSVEEVGFSSPIFYKWPILQVNEHIASDELDQDYIQKAENKNENASFAWWHPGKAKSFKWWHKALMDFMVKYPEHHTELERQLGDLENVVIEGDHLVVKAKSSKVDSAWRKKCKEKLEMFFHDHTVENLHVRNFDSAMLDDSKTYMAKLWPSEECIVIAVAGLTEDVAQKINTIKQQDKQQPYEQNRKKKVSVKWRCPNQEIFTFVKKSTKQMEQFVKFLGEIGSPVLDDGFVTVHSEILVILPTENWKASCQSKISEFFDQFYTRIIEISDGQEMLALTLIENRSSVTTKWIQERNCLQICGVKAAVNLKVDLIKKKLEQSESQPLLADFDLPTTDDINTTQRICQEKNEFGQTTVTLQLTETKIKCVLASETLSELCNVSIERQPDGVKISGKRHRTWIAKNFIDSIIADELEVKTYGAYEFLTDSTIGMQMEHFGIKHNCSIVVEQIIDSEWGEQKFISLPVECKKENLFGELSVLVEEGDITEDDADMIVNTSDKSFSFNGHLSRVIFSKAGEYLKVMFHQNKFDSEMGITLGGNLRCRKIAHVAIPASHESMEALIAKILTKADEHGMESITLPTIEAGGGGWSSQDVAIGMKNGIIKFRKENRAVTSLKRVKVMLFPSARSSDKKPFYDELTNAPDSSMGNSGATSKNENDQSLLYKFISFFKRQPDRAPEPEKSGDSPMKDLTSYEPQGESHAKKTEHGEFARIIISSKSEKCVKSAKEEMQKFVSRHLKEFTFDLTAILRLKHSHIEKMRQIAEKQKVRIIVNNEKKVPTITIQGPDEYISQARDEIQRIISAISTDLPETWCEMPEGKKLLRVTLKPNSEEYNKVEQRFTEANKSWGQYTVVKIERVQNPTLYQQYQSKKAEISARKSTSAEVDRKLFHGSERETIDKICNDVFNRSYAGGNATAYGKGVYFSTQSSYSNLYTSQNWDGTRQMFLARVLTGDYCQGNSSMVDAPKNPATGELYDSVVDSVNNPTVFVVFRDWSVYPSYVITYRN